MEIRLQQLLLLCFVICLGLIDRSASKDVIGIAPQDENYYKGLSSGSIKCKDGSKKFTKDQLNDDYCDCSDGSDEPGTSACPNGKFYCKNAGNIPLSIYSSRVNDGICDCCDGSDEYDGKTKCPNTCWEAGKVARDKLKKKIATYQEGVTLRKKEVEEAKLAISKEEAELSKLKNQEKKLKDLVEQLKEHKERIEKAKEEERLKKEKEEKDRKEAEDAKLEAAKAEEKTEVQEDAVKSDVHDKIGLLNESPAAQDVVEGHDKDMKKVEHDHKSHKDELVGDEVEHDDQSHKDESVGDEVEQVPEDSQEKDTTENTESLSKEELGRVVASRWMDKKSEQTNEDVDAGTKSNYDSSDEGPTDSHGEEYNEYDSEDEHKYDDDDTEDQIEDIGGDDHDSISSYKSDSDDDSDFSATSSPSWMEKIQRTVKDIFRAVNLFQTPVNISNAAHVRKEYDESSAKLSKVQSRISSLEKKLKQDFGPEKEFYSFYGQCFETKQNKYTYKICPFKDATQVEGYSTTRLGNWDKFADSYRTIQFSSGDKCWNGPDRSIKVKLRCGLKNELTDVDEPSRCEYIAFLATPALCLEEKLKELQDKLEAMNKQQPEGHDEL